MNKDVKMDIDGFALYVRQEMIKFCLKSFSNAFGTQFDIFATLRMTCFLDSHEFKLSPDGNIILERIPSFVDNTTVNLTLSMWQ